MAKTIKKETNLMSGQTTIEYIIYFLFGIMEMLLILRLAFKLTGANPISSFVGFTYQLTEIFITPFAGIFSQTTSQGLETTSVFEPATLVAIVVYGVFAWGISQIMLILSPAR